MVPARLRSAVLAIYRFARAADDLADEGTASDAERLAALARFDACLDAIERGDVPDEEPFPAVALEVRRHDLPLSLFHDLLSAFSQDVTVKRYARIADVHDYCRRSADPIGRLLLHLYKVATPVNLRRSDAICTALQLINFWQDVENDWQRGRVYLPAEDLARFRVTEAHIAQGRVDSAWRALMRFEVGRTRAQLESGRPLVSALPWRLALELSGVIAGGHTILDGVEAADGDVFRHRPKLGKRAWTMVAWRALFPPRRHRRATHWVDAEARA